MKKVRPQKIDKIFQNIYGSELGYAIVLSADMSTGLGIRLGFRDALLTSLCLGFFAC